MPCDRPDWIPTFTGKRFCFDRPTPEMVCIEDVAHSLSNVCRFGGRTAEFYSVAQHSVIVSEFVPVQFALHGLLHDAAEAYIGDITTPLKVLLNHMSDGSFAVLEAGINLAIWQKFDMYWNAESHSAVKLADEIALATEARDLLLGGQPPEWWDHLPRADNARIIPVEPMDAEANFLDRFRELMDMGIGGAVHRKSVNDSIDEAARVAQQERGKRLAGQE